MKGFQSKLFLKINLYSIYIIHITWIMSQKFLQTIRTIEKMDKTISQGRIQNFFACQCGKKYGSFPALYLHFKRSHKIKISTRVTQELCNITESENQKTFTYFYSQSQIKLRCLREKVEIQCLQNNILQKVLLQFNNENVLLAYNSWVAQWTFDELKKYILSCKTLRNGISNLKIIEELPIYFNDFVLSNQGYMRSKQFYGECCNILLQFGKWLNLKKYSAYVLEPEQSALQNL